MDMLTCQTSRDQGRERHVTFETETGWCMDYIARVNGTVICNLRSCVLPISVIYASVTAVNLDYCSSYVSKQ